MKKHLDLRLIVIGFSLVCVLMGCKNSPQKPTDILQRAKSTEFIVEYLECCINLKDQSLIADLVLNADSGQKRRAALDFLTDKTLLQKVVKESQDNFVIPAANNRLQKVRLGQSLDTYSCISFIIGFDGIISVEKDSITSIIKGAKEFPTATFKEAKLLLIP